MNLIPIDKILANPWQTRIADPAAEYIKDLALNIAKNGLLQTPVGRQMDSDQVQLAFGHNRLEAYRWLEDMKESSNLEGDWSVMPVEVRELTDEQMANMAWSENEKRRDVTPIERAKAIQKRIEDFKWSNREAAEALGIDHSTISNILRLLKLPDELQQALQAEEITERQAGAILVLFELPEFIENYFRKNDIIFSARQGVSSDQLREKVDSYLSYYGKKLEGAEFKLNQLIPEGGRIYCGTCSNCDKRMANRNLCFGMDCFTAKKQFVRRKYLEEASFISGFGILDPNKGGNPTYLSNYNGEIEKIKATKCPNLVLAYVENKSEDVPGFPHALLVCEKRNNSCSCLAGLRANEALQHRDVQIEEESDEDDSEVSTDELIEKQADLQQPAEPEMPAAPSARDLEEAARQMRRNKKDALDRMPEIVKLVEDRLVQALKEDLPGIFFLIVHHSIWTTYRDNEFDLEGLYRQIAHSLASYPIMPSNPTSLEQMVQNINDKLTRLQLEPISLEKKLVEVFEKEEVRAQTEQGA